MSATNGAERTLAGGGPSTRVSDSFLQMLQYWACASYCAPQLSQILCKSLQLLAVRRGERVAAIVFFLSIRRSVMQPEVAAPETMEHAFDPSDVARLDIDLEHHLAVDDLRADLAPRLPVVEREVITQR